MLPTRATLPAQACTKSGHPAARRSHRWYVARINFRTLPLALGASLCLVAPAFADSGTFEGVAVFAVGETTPPMQMTWTVKGTKARIEMQRPEGKGFGSSMLMDMQKGSTTMLMVEQKAFMTMDLKAMAEKAAKQHGLEPKAAEAQGALKPEATGKSETIAGIRCEHSLMGQEHSLDVCAAKGMGVMSRWSPGFKLQTQQS